MTPWTGTLAAVAIVSGVPLAVVATLAAARRTLRRVVPGLVTFGAGSLAGAAVFHLVPESWERHPAASWIALCLTVGLVGSHLLERAVHRWQGSEHAHAPDDAAAAEGAEDDDAAMVVLNFVGDAVHNMTDGALVAVSFLAGLPTGMVVAAAILTHELPRELGTFALFVHYGTSPRRAVLYNALTGALALVGAALALLIGERVTAAAAVVLPFAAGAFLYLAGAVILSQLRRRGTWELSPVQAMCGLAGLGVSALARIWH